MNLVTVQRLAFTTSSTSTNGKTTSPSTPLDSPSVGGKSCFCYQERDAGGGGQGGAAGGPGDQHSTVPGLRQGPGVAKEAEAAAAESIVWGASR